MKFLFKIIRLILPIFVILLPLTNAVIVPRNILYYLPITLYNYQSSALQTNTALPIGTTSNGNIIGFNALEYSKYETCNLNNAEFFYANGTIIYSWMEGNYLNEQTSNTICNNVFSKNALASSANILYWIKIGNNAPSFLPAGSQSNPTSNTIYIGWAGNVISPANTLLNGQTTGEAPELSCNNPSNTISGCSFNQYAEYDNGNQIFSFYDNFAGSTLNNNLWGNYIGASPIISNSLKITETTNGDSSAIQSKSEYYGPNYVFQTEIINGTAQTDGHDSGIILSSNTLQSGQGWRFVWGSNFVFAGIHEYQNLGILSTEVVSASNNVHTPNIDGGNTVYPLTISSVWPSATIFNATFDYGAISPATSNSDVPSPQNVFFVLGTNWGGSSSSYFSIQWARTFPVPPNYEYPKTTFGSVYNLTITSLSASNVILDGTQYLNLTAKWNVGTSPYTINYIISNSITGSILTYQQYTGLTNTYNSLILQIPSAWIGNSLQANVTLTNSGSNSITTNSIPLSLSYVYNPLNNLQFTVSNQIINIGQQETLTAEISGGANSITYANFDGSTSNVLTQINHMYGDTNGTTFSAWIYPESSELAGYGTIIFGYQGWVSDNDGILYYYTNENGNTGGGTLPQNKWSFITATVTTDVNPVVTLYINGNNVASSTFSGITGSGGCQNENETIVIGNYSGTCGAYGATGPFNGLIANAQIYNELLTPSSVNALYDEGITGAPITFNGLQGWYLLNQNANFNGANVINYASTRSYGVPNKLVYYTTYNAYSYNFTVYNSLGDIVLQQKYNSPNNAQGIPITSNTITFSTSSFQTGTYTANVVIKDSATTQMIATNSLTFIVTNSPTVTINPSSTNSIDQGQSVSFTSSVSGGTSPYTYQWYSGASSTCTSDTTALGTLSTQYVSPSTNTYYCLKITDANSKVGYSIPTEILVNPTPTVSILPSTIQTINQGQSVSFTSSVSGGTSPDTYQWYEGSSPTCTSDTAISGATSNTYLATPSSLTYYCLSVTDSSIDPYTTTSPTTEIIVSNALSSNSLDGKYAYVEFDLSNKVSIINTTTNTITKNLTSFYNPLYLFIDQGGTHLFVGNGYNVNITNTENGTVYKQINFQSEGMAFTPDGKYAYISNGYQDINLMSLSNYTIIKNLYYPNLDPQGMIISPNGSDLYVLSIVNNLIYVISTKNNSVIKEFSSPQIQNPISIAETPDGKYLYITMQFKNRVGVFYANNGTFVNNIDIVNATDIAISPNQNVAYVTQNPIIGGGNYHSTAMGGIVILNTASNLVVGNIVIPNTLSGPEGIVFGNYSNIYPSITLTPSNTILESGQTEVLTASISEGIAPYTYNFLIYNPSGVQVYNALYSGISSPTNTFIFQTSGSAGMYTANVIITDSKNRVINSSTEYELYAQLAANQITPSNIIIDQGQSKRLNSNVYGGIPPYTINWYESSSGNPSCSPANIINNNNNPYITVNPSTSAFYTYQVIDSNPTSNDILCSSSAEIEVNPILSIGNIIISNTSEVINKMQDISLHVSGGTPPYSYRLVLFNNSEVNVLYQINTNSLTSNTFSFVQNGAWGIDKFSIAAEVFDATNASVINNSYYNTYPKLRINSLSASNQIIIPGNTQVLSTNIIGGISPYTYNFLVYNAIGSLMTNDISTSNTLSFSISPSNIWTSGFYTANVFVSDSANPNDIVNSSTNFLICPGVTFNGGISNKTVDLNQKQNVSITVLGCDPPYTYTFNAFSPGGILKYQKIISNTNSLNESVLLNANETGIWTVNVIVVDSESPAKSYFNSYTYNVLSDPSISLTPTTQTIDSGQSLTLTGTSTGGVAPYSYKWYTSNSLTTLCTPSNEIPYNALSFISIKPSSSSSYAVSITDSATTTYTTCSSSSYISVNPSLAVPLITPQLSQYDLGNNVTLTASWSGGTKPYAINWTLFKGFGKITNILINSYNSNSNTIIFPTNNFIGTGTFNENISVYDASNPISYTNSTNATIIINQDPSISITAQNTIKYGSQIYINAHISGGSPPFKINITSINGSTVYSLSNIYSRSPVLGPISLNAGSYTFNAIAIDSANTPVVFASNSNSIDVLSNSITQTTTTPIINTGGLPPSNNSSTTTTSSTTSTISSTTSTLTTTILTSVVTTTTLPVNITNQSKTINGTGIKLSIINPKNNHLTVFINNITNQIKTQQSLSKISAFNISLIGNISTYNGPIANLSLNYPCAVNTSDLGIYFLRNNTWNKISNYTINKQECAISLSISHNVTVALFLNENLSNITNPNAIPKASNTISYSILIMILIIIIILLIIIILIIRRRKRSWRSKR